MSRRPAPAAGSAVSLFPFLAVLLCTIGSLVLLLVLVARQAKSEAEREAAQKRSAPAVDLAELGREREDLDWQIEQLETSRQKTAEMLVEQRAHLSHLEEHAQRLREEIRQWEEAQRQLAARTSLDAVAQEQLKAELAELKRRAAEADEKLKDAKGRVKRTAFAVVPYEGQNGTRRRPIYIECRADAIVIQPEGIVFTENDFTGSLGPSNPLAACVRATAEHYARTGSLEAGEQPYPFLLVRPDGIMAYYVARAAMSSWDSEFGYELVEGAWTLDFPRTDPQLQQLLTNVQHEARRRQEMIARAAPSLRQTERPSFRSLAGGDAPGDLDQGLPGTGGGLPTAGGNGGGAASSGIDAPYVAPRGHVSDAGSAGVPGGMSGTGGSYGVGGNGTGGGLGGGGALDAAGYNGGGPAGSGGPQLINPAGAPGSGYAGGPNDGQPGAANSGTYSGQPGGGSFAGGGGYPGGGGTGGGGASYNNGNAPGGDGQRYGSTGTGGQPNSQQYGSSSSPSDSAMASAQSGRYGSAANSELGGSDGGQAGMYGTGGGAGGSAGSPGGSASGGGMSMGSGSAGGGSGASSGSGGSGGGAPTISMVQQTRSPTGPGDLDSLAKKRGKDWSLPDAARRSTPVSRPVQIYCSADRLTIMSDRNVPDRQINLGPRTSESVDELVKAVWEQVEAWGLAGRGMYWRPTLSIHYAPDGAVRFDELRTLLAGSGLEVTGKPIHVAAPTPIVTERR